MLLPTLCTLAHAACLDESIYSVVYATVVYLVRGGTGTERLDVELNTPERHPYRVPEYADPVSIAAGGSRS